MRVWHNGPNFDERLPSTAVDVELSSSGENLGFGAGHNRLFARTTEELVIVVNPDCRLDPQCLERLEQALAQAPRAILAAATLVDTDGTRRVNAYAQRLTYDLLGINPDRGRAQHELVAARELETAPRRYLGPSGALFAVARKAWDERVGGPLFAESLFLYLEDVALALKVRRVGGEVCFCPGAWAEHSWSVATGQQSALKLYHVERNRLWLTRALWGTAAATALLPFTLTRYAAYLAPARRQRFASGAAWQLREAAWRAFKDGYGAIPAELGQYLDVAAPERLQAGFFASLAEQLRNPLSSAKG